MIDKIKKLEADIEELKARIASIEAAHAVNIPSIWVDHGGPATEYTTTCSEPINTDWINIEPLMTIKV
jgi:hypothetical protein